MSAEVYERYLRLKERHGVSDYAVAKACGIGQSTFTDWKNGRSTPKADKLKKIADYFGVSLEYLMGEEEPDPEVVAPDEKEYLQILKDDPRYKVLLHAAKDLDDDDFKAVADFAERLRRTYRD